MFPGYHPYHGSTFTATFPGYQRPMFPGDHPYHGSTITAPLT